MCFQVKWWWHHYRSGVFGYTQEFLCHHCEVNQTVGVIYYCMFTFCYKRKLFFSNSEQCCFAPASNVNLAAIVEFQCDLLDILPAFLNGSNDQSVSVRWVHWNWDFLELWNYSQLVTWLVIFPMDLHYTDVWNSTDIYMYVWWNEQRDPFHYTYNACL